MAPQNDGAMGANDARGTGEVPQQHARSMRALWRSCRGTEGLNTRRGLTPQRYSCSLLKTLRKSLKLRSTGKQIGKDKLIANHGIADRDREDSFEHWPGIHKRMEFPAFSAGIHFLGQSRKQCFVKLAANEGSIEFCRVNTSQLGPRTRRNHLLG